MTKCENCGRKDINRAIRKEINDAKLSLRQGQWSYTSGQGSAINHLADLKELLRAIEELYEEYGFGWINFDITWDTKDSKIWTKKQKPVSLLKQSKKGGE